MSGIYLKEKISDEEEDGTRIDTITKDGDIPPTFPITVGIELMSIVITTIKYPYYCLQL